MAKFYASLTGPFMGTYYPMPVELETEDQCRVACQTSKLSALWCAIYSFDDAMDAVRKHGGALLEPGNWGGADVDYDYHKVFSNGS